MKTHKLSIIGYIIGAVIIGCSTIQWFFRFPDPSQLIFGLFVGIIVCGFAYLYNWMREQENERVKTNKRLDAFTKWWTEKEM